MATGTGAARGGFEMRGQECSADLRVCFGRKPRYGVGSAGGTGLPEPWFAQALECEPMCLAVPGQVLSVAGDEPLSRTGRVSFGGVVKEVSLALVPEAGVGDYVLVHVGVAISKVDAEEARQVFEYLQQMQDLAEVESAAAGAAPAAAAGPEG